MSKPVWKKNPAADAPHSPAADKEHMDSFRQEPEPEPAPPADKLTITVSGPAKVGKSTIAALLYDTLCRRGFVVELVDLDGETDTLHLMKGRNARIIANLVDRCSIEVVTLEDGRG